MIKPTLWRAALGIMALVVPLGCSSGDPTPNVSDMPDRAEGVESIEAGLGEASCATAVPNATYMGDIAIPDTGRLSLDEANNPSFWSNLGYVTTNNYSNGRCFKAVVVKITNWLRAPKNLVVVPRAQHVAIQTQAVCEGLYMSATVYGPLFSTTNPGPQGPGFLSPITQVTRTARGVWTPAVFPRVGSCQLPSLVFGGSTSRDGDYDLFQYGATYTIAATYRSNGATQALSIYTPKLGCGENGDACCTANDFGNPYCTGLNTCHKSTGQCVPCGESGLEACATGPACATDHLTPFLTQHGENGVSVQQQTCFDCGTSGHYCCAKPNTACDSGLSCQGGGNGVLPTCQPTPTPPTPPTPTLITGTKCNGQQATTATRTFPVQVEDGFGCGDVYLAQADSTAEANACASARGLNVFSGLELDPYKYCVCSFGGTGPESIPSYSLPAANLCIAAVNINAFQIWPGDCTSQEETTCVSLQ